MPQGQLLLRSKGTIALSSGSTGLITSNAPGNKSGWVDAFLRYNLSLEPGALAKLISYPSHKQPTGNNAAGMNGVAYMGSTIGCADENTMSLDMHISASSKNGFKTAYEAFYNEVLKYGYVQVMTDFDNSVHHLVYQSQNPETLTSREQMIFSLNFIEPHPEIRTHLEPSILGTNNDS